MKINEQKMSTWNEFTRYFCTIEYKSHLFMRVFKKMMLTALSLSVVCSLYATTPIISVNPMFLKIYSGGDAIVKISNASNEIRGVGLRVVDRFGLESRYCEIGSSHIDIDPNSTVSVDVSCAKNRDKGMSFIVVDQSNYEIRELRRVVLYR